MGPACFVAAHQAQDVGASCQGLFIGATFLSGLIAKVPATGWSEGARPALLARAPRIVGVPEMAVG